MGLIFQKATMAMVMVMATVMATVKGVMLRNIKNSKNYFS